MRLRLLALTAAALLCAAPHAAAQSPVLIQAQAGSPAGDRFRVDSSGAFVAYGFVRDVGNTTGCAAQLPASGAGTRFMWHPCRGSLRFGRAPVGAGATSWDDNNMDDFTFAGGNQVTASDYGAFAYGDQVTVSSTVGVGFGSGVTVSGTAGFSAGASNVCSGFACTAIGYTVRAGGQGSVALGYRTTANNDYAVALGYRASNNTHTGTMVMGDESTTDSVRNQVDNEFRIRYNGGIRLRVSTAANGMTPGAGGNVGCDLTVAVPTWTCASSRTLKENYEPVNGEDVLIRLRSVPVTTWNMIGGAEVRHLGPVAEDFYQAFALGLGPTAIGMGDIDGVNLAAAKALEARTVDLQAQLNVRTAHVVELQAQVDAQAAVIARMEERLRALESRP
ncbi:tail fiber domain-containing protein [Longimicrobium sp.]|uniref:tail fiber domain-containing protein n=1 Tax=Longimicrobium sp. TaxID=2029185 RepID=UPI002E3692D7|nr:tail fiber domain-containing protein [Longimicrobium sp.]HEX6037018.1 tail fiber domain-containing protein [Longimicrobium sp.]